jgi:hypothetical protein
MLKWGDHSLYNSAIPDLIKLNVSILELFYAEGQINKWSNFKRCPWEVHLKLKKKLQ